MAGDADGALLKIPERLRSIEGKRTMILAEFGERLKAATRAGETHTGQAASLQVRGRKVAGLLSASPTTRDAAHASTS